MCFGYTTIEFVYFFVKVVISRIYLFLGNNPPPLLEAIAGVMIVILVVKRDNVIAVVMKNSALFGYIVV